MSTVNVSDVGIGRDRIGEAYAKIAAVGQHIAEGDPARRQHPGRRSRRR